MNGFNEDFPRGFAMALRYTQDLRHNLNDIELWRSINFNIFGIFDNQLVFRDNASARINAITWKAFTNRGQSSIFEACDVKIKAGTTTRVYATGDMWVDAKMNVVLYIEGRVLYVNQCIFSDVNDPLYKKILTKILPSATLGGLTIAIIDDESKKKVKPFELTKVFKGINDFNKKIYEDINRPRA